MFDNLCLVLTNWGKAFEFMLAYELCGLSELYRKILDKQSSPIKFKLSDIKSMKTLPNKVTVPYIIDDSGGGHEQGDHKIDLVFPYKKGGSIGKHWYWEFITYNQQGVIYIQVVNQDHNSDENQTRKLNEKIRNSIVAFSKYAHENAIFGFASYHHFHVTSFTDTLMQKFDNNWKELAQTKKKPSKDDVKRIDNMVGKDPKKLKIFLLRGEDFENLTWPFHMFANKNELSTPNLLGKLVREQREIYGMYFFTLFISFHFLFISFLISFLIPIKSKQNKRFLLKIAWMFQKSHCL
jgi:hypothetical protein